MALLNFIDYRAACMRQLRFLCAIHPLSVTDEPQYVFVFFFQIRYNAQLVSTAVFGSKRRVP